MNKKTGQIPIGTIESKIYLIRGQRMILDMDLANIYQVQTGQLIQAVKRNFSRFPIDFMFQILHNRSNIVLKYFLENR